MHHPIVTSLVIVTTTLLGAPTKRNKADEKNPPMRLTSEEEDKVVAEVQYVMKNFVVRGDIEPEAAKKAASVVLDKVIELHTHCAPSEICATTQCPVPSCHERPTPNTVASPRRGTIARSMFVPASSHHRH